MLSAQQALHVADVDLAVRIRAHRPVLNDREPAAVPTDALLSIEDRKTRVESDADGDDSEDWREDDDADCCERQVETSLVREIRRGRWPSAVVDVLRGRAADDGVGSRVHALPTLRFGAATT